MYASYEDLGSDYKVPDYYKHLYNLNFVMAAMVIIVSTVTKDNFAASEAIGNILDLFCCSTYEGC